MFRKVSLDRSAHQTRVEAFMGKASQAVPDEPTIPEAGIRVLRAKLIFEEAMETVFALGIDVMVGAPVNQYDAVPLTLEQCEFEVNQRRGPNLIEIADGCADISVVTIGTLSACGIKDKPLLEEVDKSNLEKFGPGSRRREDGKQLKPDGWQPPRIAKVLQEQAKTSDVS